MVKFEICIRNIIIYGIKNMNSYTLSVTICTMNRYIFNDS